MSKTNNFETSLLALIFNATPIADLAENDASSPLANLYVSLHTADPGEAGAQNTSEASYTSYARVAVARNSGGWTVASGAATNTAAVIFPQATGGSNTLTHFGVGSLVSGAGVLYYKGALSASLAVSNGIQPQFAINDIDVNED